MPTRARKAPNTNGQFDKSGHPNEILNQSDIQRFARILIPTSAIEAITDSLDQLQSEDQCQLLLPTSNTAESIVYASSVNDDKNVVSKAHSIDDLTPDEHTIIKSLAQVCVRIAVLALPEVQILEPEKDLIYDETAADNDSSLNRIEVKLIITNEMAGNIIGSKGSNIRELRKTHSELKEFSISRQNCPNSTNRITKIQGASKFVYEALIDILKISRTTEQKEKLTIERIYNANSACNSYDYGGFIKVEKKPNGRSLSRTDTASMKSTSDFTERMSSDDHKPLTAQVNCRLLVYSHISGRIIGKSGSNVNDLREFYKVSIQINKSNSDDRVVEIMSDKNEDNLSSVVNVVSRIIHMMKIDFRETAQKFNYKLKGNRDYDEKVTEVRVLVNRNTCGRIVGKGGATIKALRTKHDCEITCYAVCCPGSNERVLAISGEIDDICSCLTEVIAHCHEGRDQEWRDQPTYTGLLQENQKDVKSLGDYGGYIKQYGQNSSPSKSGRKRDSAGANMNQNNTMMGMGNPA